MKKVIVLVAIIALLLCGCAAPEAGQIVDVTASAQTPSDIEPTVEPEPTPIPIPSPVTYTGSGDDVIDVTPFPSSLYVFEISGNDAESNFIITTCTVAPTA